MKPKDKRRVHAVAMLLFPRKHYVRMMFDIYRLPVIISEDPDKLALMTIKIRKFE
jgi:hypothetical protein